MFEKESEFSAFVAAKGGRAFLVGGAVRDSLAGNPVKDRDYVVTGLLPSDLPAWRIAGHDAPVFLVEVDGEVCQIAMARTEKKNGVGHCGFDFFTSPDVSIEEDLWRRDLTVNAMAVDLQTRELIDPFGGQADLEAGILRHVSSAFAEDPLRVFRVARFAARFGFEVDSSTLQAMSALRKELRTLPAERVWLETKAALMTKFPARFFQVLDEAEVLDVWFPELSALHVPDKHDGTAFNHVMSCLHLGQDLEERFGLLVHDLGKGCTDPALHPAHHGHDKHVEVLRVFCARLRVPKKLQAFGELCLTEHMKVKLLSEMKPGKLLRFLLSCQDFNKVAQVSFLESMGRFSLDSHVHNLMLWACAKEAEKTFNGKNLLAEGRKPGPEFGELLFQRRVQIFKELRHEL